MAIVGIIGNLGSGKTILLTCALIDDLERGRQCFANYHISYKTDDGRSIHTVDTGRLVEWLTNVEKHRYPLGGASLGLDEIYMDMDCLHEDTIVITRYGAKKISTILPGEEIMSIFGFQTVDAIHKLKTNVLFEVKTRNRMILCTNNHILPVRGGNGHLHPVTVQRLYESINHYPESNFKYKHYLFSEKNPIRPLKLSSINVLFGILAAEGTISSRKLMSNGRMKDRIEISMDERESSMQNFIKMELLKLYPDIHLGIVHSKMGNKHGIRFEFGQKYIVADVNFRFERFMSGTPTKAEAAAFLRGFFEGDGTVGQHSVLFTQSLCKRKRRYLVFAKRCLDILSIKYTTFKRKDVMNGKVFLSETVLIYSKHELRKFSILCGFISKIKNSKVEKHLFGHLHMFHYEVKHEKITSIRKVYGDYTVYDISMHSTKVPYFYANGLLSHNSRASQAMSSRLLSHFVFQSRKLGLDLYFTGQLASSIDKRLKNLCDIWVVAEKVIEPVLDWEGKQTGVVIEKFNYAQLDRDEKLTEFSILPENAKNIFPYYSTSEIVDPSQMTVDKSETKRIVKSMGKAVSGRKPKKGDVDEEL